MSPETINTEQIITESIKQAQSIEGPMNAESIMAIAKGKLEKQKPHDDDAEGKANFERAQAAIEAARARFEKAVQDITLRTQLNTRLSQVDPEKDFLHANQELSQIKQENTKLPAEMQLGQDLVTKAEAVSQKAESFYETRKNVGWEQGGKMVEGLLTVSDPTNVRRVMADVSEMQRAVSEGFPGVDSAKAQAYTAAYNAKIDLGMQWLQQNKDAKAGSRAEGEDELPVMNADEKAALERMDFARKNLAGAEKGSPHEAGAKEYMTMVTAEQEARGVWSQFPVDNPDLRLEFNAASIMDQAVAAKEGPAKTFYNQAVQTFKEAVSKSGRTDKPTYAEATKLFQKAADLFRQSLSEMNSNRETNELEVAKKEAQEQKDKMWANWNTKIKPLPDVVVSYVKSKGLNTEKMADDYFNKEGATAEDYADAKLNYEGADKQYMDALKDYQALVARGPTDLNRAFEQIRGDESITSTDAMIATVTNYLSNPQLWNNDPGLEKVYKTLVINGNFAGKENESYNVYASYSGDKPNVKIVPVDDDKGALGTFDPAHPELMARHEVRTKEEMQQQIKDRVDEAIRWNTTEHRPPEEVDKNIQDFIADTMRRFTPAEMALLQDVKIEDVPSPNGRKAVAINDKGEVGVENSMVA